MLISEDWGEGRTFTSGNKKKKKTTSLYQFIYLFKIGTAFISVHTLYWLIYTVLPRLVIYGDSFSFTAYRSITLPNLTQVNHIICPMGYSQTRVFIYIKKRINKEKFSIWKPRTINTEIITLWKFILSPMKAWNHMELTSWCTRKEEWWYCQLPFCLVISYFIYIYSSLRRIYSTNPSTWTAVFKSFYRLLYV